jgi:hypothetical protein
VLQASGLQRDWQKIDQGIYTCPYSDKGAHAKQKSELASNNSKQEDWPQLGCVSPGNKFRKRPKIVNSHEPVCVCDGAVCMGPLLDYFQCIISDNEFIENRHLPVASSSCPEEPFDLAAPRPRQLPRMCAVVLRSPLLRCTLALLHHWYRGVTNKSEGTLPPSVSSSSSSSLSPPSLQPGLQPQSCSNPYVSFWSPYLQTLAEPAPAVAAAAAAAASAAGGAAGGPSRPSNHQSCNPTGALPEPDVPCYWSSEQLEELRGACYCSMGAAHGYIFR